MTQGHIDNNNENFPLGNAYDVDIIIWEEARLQFQNVDLFKKVLEGRDYVINVKHDTAKFQVDWTPIIITTNDSSFPSDVWSIDQQAIREWCYKVECMDKWYSVSGRELELVDLEEISRILDAKWVKLE